MKDHYTDVKRFYRFNLRNLIQYLEELEKQHPKAEFINMSLEEDFGEDKILYTTFYRELSSEELKKTLSAKKRQLQNLEHEIKKLEMEINE